MAATEPLSEYAPVLALTVLRKYETHSEILTGVRTEAANATHANVISVPTQRVPVLLAERWLAELDRGAALADDLMREVEHLLARKLGLADALELGTVTLDIRAVGVWQGTSVIGEDEDGPVTEELTMFNACVEVTAGADLFPAETASYQPLVWAPTTDFLKMVQSREAGALNVGLDEIMVCVYGLCLESSVRTLDMMAESGVPGLV
jgi:hypothetical protein